MMAHVIHSGHYNPDRRRQALPNSPNRVAELQKMVITMMNERISLAKLLEYS